MVDMFGQEDLFVVISVSRTITLITRNLYLVDIFLGTQKTFISIDTCEMNTH